MISNFESKPELKDRLGQIIKKGSFAYFSREDSELPPGPYRYEGFRYGAHVFSVPGMDFLHSKFVPEFLELLPWKRWREPKLHLERVLKSCNATFAKKR